MIQLENRRFLALAVVVFVICVGIFGGIASDVIHGNRLTRIDTRISAWVPNHSTPQLTAAMLVLTDLGNTYVLGGLAFLIALFLLWKRDMYWLTVILLAVPGGSLLDTLLKDAFQRPRPELNSLYSGYSFPSGHAMLATVTYGWIAAFAVRKTSSRRWHVIQMLIAALLIAIVGFSRIYLEAHYFSDVLAAIASGLAWLAFCFLAVLEVRKRRAGT